MGNFDLLKKISFERVAGSKNELLAAKIIKKEVEKLGIECVLENFQIEFPLVLNAEFEILAPIKKSFAVKGLGLSGSTIEGGIVADFLYVDSADEISLVNAEGKIVMINNLTYDAYKNLINAKVSGIVCFSGDIYDNALDVEERYLRPRHYNSGRIPGVNMSIQDAQKLLEIKPTRVRLLLKNDEEQLTSTNVVATIIGTHIQNEIICFTAHYDSVQFSSGAYDNASGSIGVLDILKHYSINPPKRTLKFIWCGTEERGLLGSKAYILKHNNTLENYRLNINIDMIGNLLGYNIACCTTETNVVTYLDYLAKEVGYSLKTQQGVYSSDSTPFADAKIPAISFARVSAPGGAKIHSKRDIIDVMNEEIFNKNIQFIKEFADRMVNAVFFPIPKIIPANMVEAVDEYLGKAKK